MTMCWVQHLTVGRVQVAGLWAVGAVTTLCAMVAYSVLGGVLAAAGLPAQLALSPTAFAVFALAALFNPLYVALLPVLLPVSMLLHTPVRFQSIEHCYLYGVRLHIRH